ncbi:MAG: PEP-CTERM sorting domain-containing protein [Rhodocyclaceae bacterium]|nr:PEP-CTERM sorting domain-containing protein [Rhodocyclaceae bacterium]
MNIPKTAIALALALAAPLAAASTGNFVVRALENSSTGGAGVATFALIAGQQFSVAVSPDDLWNAGALPRWSNADGLTGNLLYSAVTDAEVPVYLPATLVGQNFGNHVQNGLSAPFGSLVGQIDNGSFFKIGTSYTGTAAASGTLKLFYFDSNNHDNTGSILAQVTAVPEPETYAMLLAGLGLMGGIARRRRKA